MKTDHISAAKKDFSLPDKIRPRGKGHWPARSLHPGLRVAVVVANEFRFEDVRAHCFGPRRDAGPVIHWLPHYETACDALTHEAYDVAVLDSRHHGSALLQAMARSGAKTPAVLLVDDVCLDGNAAKDVTSATLHRNAMGSGRLHQALHEVVDRAVAAQAAMHSQTWWRCGGVTVSHATDFPLPLETHGNFFVDAAELERPDQLLAGVLHRLPMIVGRLDSAGRIREIDGAGLTRHGLEARQLVGAQFITAFPEARNALERVRTGEAARFAACVNAGTAEAWHVEFDLFRGHGDAAGIVFFGQEVTARRGLESQLLHAVDAERHRIGADLHDEVGQLLTGITCLSAALVERLRGRNDLAAEDATTIADVAKEALAQIRALAHGLAPVHLARHGLEGALDELRIQVRRMHGVDLRLQLPTGRNEFDGETTGHLFRITQEAIANAIRHGKAKTIEVSLRCANGQHRLVIADNGRGFDPALPQAADTGSGLGLMEYRATLIRGNLTVCSSQVSGTRIEVSFTPVDTCPHETAC